MGLSEHIQYYEDSRLIDYMNQLDAHDRYEMAVEQEYQVLCAAAFSLRKVLKDTMSDALDTLLWNAAEAHIQYLANTSED